VIDCSLPGQIMQSTVRSVRILHDPAVPRDVSPKKGRQCNDALVLAPQPRVPDAPRVRLTASPTTSSSWTTQLPSRWNAMDGKEQR
jgi:hypothetical protein